MKMLGMRKDGFGIAMITAVGKLGFINATAPFTSISLLIEVSPIIL